MRHSNRRYSSIIKNRDLLDKNLVCVSNRRYSSRSEIIGIFLCYGILGLLQPLMTLTCTQCAAPFPSQRFLMYLVCILLAECLITLGQFDLRCSTAVLPVVPVRACMLSCDLRFFSRCCCFFMSDTIRQQFFRQSTSTSCCCYYIINSHNQVRGHRTGSSQTLKWRNTPGKHKQNQKWYTHILYLTQFMSPPGKYKK